MPTHTCTFPLTTKKSTSSTKKTFTSEMGVWLESHNWEYYITFTSRSTMSMKQARAKMEKFHKVCSTRFPNTQLFWVAEPFDTKYGYHTHALLLTDEKKDIKNDINSIWQSISGGSNGMLYNKTIIMPYIKDKGANFYVAKYIRSIDTDWDIY